MRGPQKSHYTTFFGVKMLTSAIAAIGGNLEVSAHILFKERKLQLIRPYVIAKTSEYDDECHVNLAGSVARFRRIVLPVRVV